MSSEEFPCKGEQRRGQWLGTGTDLGSREDLSARVFIAGNDDDVRDRGISWSNRKRIDWSARMKSLVFIGLWTVDPK